MHEITDALVALGGAFLLCGLLARAGVPIGLPTIPLFMLAGVAVGPFTPGFVLVEHPDDLAVVAKLGLIFLLFYLGLEFSLDDLTAGGRRLVAAAGTYLALNLGGGLAFGYALGWGTAEMLVIAGVVGISSSAMVTKLLVETRRLANPETRAILGIIVVEDLFLAFYLALLQPVLGGAEGLADALTGIGTAFAFLVGLGLLARHGARWLNTVVATRDEEIVIVLSVGLAVLVAGLSERLGVSDAIGAFMIGMILGATVVARRLQSLTHPLRDAFGAIFFFHFGLTIDPGSVLEVAGPVLVAAVMTVALALTAGVVTARLHGYDRGAAANIGLTVLARGEFSLVLASLALAAGLDPRIASFAAAYVLLLAVVGPAAVHLSEPISRLLPRRLFAEQVAETAPVPLDLDIGTAGLYRLGADLLQIQVLPGSRLHGVEVWELRLPLGSTLGLLAREGGTRAATPSTQLRTGDTLLVFSVPGQRQQVEDRIMAAHRGGRLAAWHAT